MTSIPSVMMKMILNSVQVAMVVLVGVVLTVVGVQRFVKMFRDATRGMHMVALIPGLVGSIVVPKLLDIVLVVPYVQISLGVQIYLLSMGERFIQMRLVMVISFLSLVMQIQFLSICGVFCLRVVWTFPVSMVMIFVASHVWTSSPVFLKVVPSFLRNLPVQLLYLSLVVTLPVVTLVVQFFFLGLVVLIVGVQIYVLSRVVRVLLLVDLMIVMLSLYTLVGIVEVLYLTMVPLSGPGPWEPLLRGCHSTTCRRFFDVLVFCLLRVTLSLKLGLQLRPFHLCRRSPLYLKWRLAQELSRRLLVRRPWYAEMKRESFVDAAAVGILGTPLALANSGPDAAAGLLLGAAAGAVYHLLLQWDVDALAPGRTPFDVLNPLRVARFLLPVLLAAALCLQAAISVGPDAWLAGLRWEPGANFVGFLQAKALSAALLGYVAATSSLQLRGVARAVPEARTLVKALPGSVGVALKEEYDGKRERRKASSGPPVREVPVLLVSGPRGCGKSTLVRQLAEGPRCAFHGARLGHDRPRPGRRGHGRQADTPGRGRGAISTRSRSLAAWL
ncbi:unnamed protein product [Prorocentrum cordatum]|uniref:Uncharacterized protein n=1 Tax=Prorocentrum cordatum TaxID=2364126 RepID=A0ABN9SVX0_9DINO|nr:unnamed protein product [Polarella glacialis]